MALEQRLPCPPHVPNGRFVDNHDVAEFYESVIEDRQLMFFKPIIPHDSVHVFDVALWNFLCSFAIVVLDCCKKVAPEPFCRNYSAHCFIFTSLRIYPFAILYFKPDTFTVSSSLVKM